MLLANSLNTLSENEERFVDACRFDHSLLTVVGATVVFGTSQIDGACCAYADFIASYLSYLDAEDCVGARGMCIQLVMLLVVFGVCRARGGRTFVAEVERLTLAWSYRDSKSFKEVQGLSVKPTTIDLPLLSRIGRPAGVRFSGGSNRSYTRSQ